LRSLWGNSREGSSPFIRTICLCSLADAPLDCWFFEPILFNPVFGRALGQRVDLLQVLRLFDWHIGKANWLLMSAIWAIMPVVLRNIGSFPAFWH
jgi:hypothetical protein